MASEDIDQQDQPTASPQEESNTIFIDDDVDFPKIFEESLQHFQEHQIVKGKVIGFQKDFVTVDIGYKSEGQIYIEEFTDENGELKAQIGDEIEVFLESVEDANGVVVLSKEKAEKVEKTSKIEKNMEKRGPPDLSRENEKCAENRKNRKCRKTAGKK